MVSSSICLPDFSILTSSATEWVQDGSVQFSVLVSTESILEARATIMRAGRENCAADSSTSTIMRTGQEWCHHSVWYLANARPLEPCPNAGCGGSHLLADCQYKTMCAGCGAIGHLQQACREKCALCAKHHSTRLCPNRPGGAPTLTPQLKKQDSQRGR